MDRQKMISCGADALKIYTVLRRAVFESYDSGKLHITRTQQMILTAMSDGETYSMSELAKRICTSNEQATRAVSQLVEMDMIKRSQNTVNHRVVNITLTEKAKSLLKETERGITERLADIISDSSDGEGMTEEDMSKFSELLEKTAGLF